MSIIQIEVGSADEPSDLPSKQNPLFEESDEFWAEHTNYAREAGPFYCLRDIGEANQQLIKLKNREPYGLRMHRRLQALGDDAPGGLEEPKKNYIVIEKAHERIRDLADRLIDLAISERDYSGEKAATEKSALLMEIFERRVEGAPAHRALLWEHLDVQSGDLSNYKSDAAAVEAILQPSEHCAGYFLK